MSIVYINYNQLTNHLEITLKNDVDLAVYFKGSYTIRTNDGERVVVGDLEPIFLDANEYKTLVYDLGDLTGTEITADILVTYGESKTSLEKIIDATIQVEIVRVEDNSIINITSVAYDKGTGEFVITIHNPGEVDAYLDIEIIDVIIDGETVTISLKDVGFLKDGETDKFRIYADLTDKDILDNEEVTVEVRYGQREQSLVKVIRGRYDVEKVQGKWVYYVLIIVIIILLLVLLFKKKKCRKCKHMNPRSRTTCEDCGEKLSLF